MNKNIFTERRWNITEEYIIDVTGSELSDCGPNCVPGGSCTPYWSCYPACYPSDQCDPGTVQCSPDEEDCYPNT